MKGIYNIRTLFEKYYSEYGNYIDAAAKFVTALILFMQINGRIGGKSIFGNIFVELILALICAILPPNVMIVLAFVAALLQFASVSIASLAVGGGVLLAVLLLYFAFASRQAWAMLLTILGLFFHVPCIVPISFGLMGSTMSAAGMAAGTVFYYTLLTIGKLGGASVDLAMAKQSTAEKILAELQTMIDTLLGEQEMILMLVVLLAVFAVVFLTRRMAMKHAWKVAIAAGTVIYLVLMMAGYMMLHLEIGILWILIGTLISAAVAFLLEQLFFNLDYRKIENLQFEDNAAVCVVLASEGYPVQYEKGYPITGLEEFSKHEGYYCFHAGTKFEDGNIVTNGGRVLGVTAKGANLKEARKNAYAATEWVQFKNKYKRNDIGKAIDEAFSDGQ